MKRRMQQLWASVLAGAWAGWVLVVTIVVLTAAPERPALGVLATDAIALAVAIGGARVLFYATWPHETKDEERSR